MRRIFAFLVLTLLSLEMYADPCASYFFVSHTEGKGVGYDKGYTSAEAWVFSVENREVFWPYIDVRAHYFNDSEFAGNLGVGFRYLGEDENFVLGCNTFLDYRRTNCHKGFFQSGLGLEVFTYLFDFRVNGYWPFKQEKKIKQCVFDQYTGGYIIEKNTMQGALRGLSFELGRAINIEVPVHAYIALGAYYYGGKTCCHFWGGKFRARVDFSRYVALEGSVTHDHAFGTNLQGTVMIKIPFTGDGYYCDPDNYDITSRPVVRNELIVIDNYCRWKWNY